jgi:NAD(P)-dependent dehydrogenase (short-subunit alcohol dehydrogenase family)
MNDPAASLRGAVAVVTGGGGDLGIAIAGELAERGARVVLADVDADRANEAAASLGAPGIDIHVRAVDLSSAPAAEGLIDGVVREFGSISTLVNAAATTQRGRINDLSEDVWDRMVAVNLSSVFWTCRAAIKHMVAAHNGVIVNIGSVAALRGLPGSPVYAATKGGVVALSRALAVDHARDGIRVHSVNPPAVDTRLYRDMFRSAPNPEEARREHEASEGAGRVLTASEVASLVVYLVEARGPVFSPEPIVW